VWTIKGTTKVTGADQMMQGGKITKIAGTGTTEVTLTDGKLPTYKHALEATFTASEAEPKTANPASLDFKIKIGGAITAK
jgi:microcystin-dependent protein